jgi:hypothetical protein
MLFAEPTSIAFLLIRWRSAPGAHPPALGAQFSADHLAASVLPVHSAAAVHPSPEPTDA